MQRAVMFVRRGDDGLRTPGNMGWLAAWHRCEVHVPSGCLYTPVSMFSGQAAIFNWGVQQALQAVCALFNLLYRTDLSALFQHQPWACVNLGQPECVLCTGGPSQNVLLPLTTGWAQDLNLNQSKTV